MKCLGVTWVSRKGAEAKVHPCFRKRMQREQCNPILGNVFKALLDETNWFSLPKMRMVVCSLFHLHFWLLQMVPRLDTKSLISQKPGSVHGYEFFMFVTHVIIQAKVLCVGKSNGKCYNVVLRGRLIKVTSFIKIGKITFSFLYRSNKWFSMGSRNYYDVIVQLTRTNQEKKLHRRVLSRLTSLSASVRLLHRCPIFLLITFSSP